MHIVTNSHDTNFSVSVARRGPQSAGSVRGSAGSSIPQRSISHLLLCFSVPHQAHSTHPSMDNPKPSSGRCNAKAQLLQAGPGRRGEGMRSRKEEENGGGCHNGGSVGPFEAGPQDYFNTPHLINHANDKPVSHIWAARHTLNADKPQS
jgi:hypothetical protein